VLAAYNNRLQLTLPVDGYVGWAPAIEAVLQMARDAELPTIQETEPVAANGDYSGYVTRQEQHTPLV
jgi:hypothetical protein